MKKGQGLSMNVIIIAAISLLVLVIISFLVIRAGGEINDGTGCQGLNGVCVNGDRYDSCADYSETTGTQYISKSGSCPNEEEFCCVLLSSN